jgi:hypothetical protein
MAMRKIVKDHEYRVLLGQIDDHDLALPLLLFSRRTYTTLHSGEIVEHGPMFVLDSVSVHDLDQCSVIELANGWRIALRPSEIFDTDAHGIGLRKGMLRPLRPFSERMSSEISEALSRRKDKGGTD